MKKQIDITIPPELLHDRERIREKVISVLKINSEDLTAFSVVRRSIDARPKNPVYQLKINAFINEPPVEERPRFIYRDVSRSKTISIVGSGPAGMFAALRLIELGYKPVIYERGKDVRNRRRDLRAIQQHNIVNPDSNYCFGEGGAGTYSDGKLYTRATKRGNIHRILHTFSDHGASHDILIDAHPHIGSNKLPGIVQSMRETILKYGGEIHFNSKLTGIEYSNGELKGIVINNDTQISTNCLILAAGHSARDVYHLLHSSGIKIEPKPFALGVRIEHPQELINGIQYHSGRAASQLPAASYNLACELNGRGVYSFCMCPGGLIIPAATSPGEIVINGMSLSRRDSPFANSGFVVSVNENDWNNNEAEFPFGGLILQSEIEQLCFRAADNTQKAPAQRVTDFLKGSVSSSLPGSSYIPGLTSAPLHELLPSFIVKPMKQALIIFNKKMKGYVTSDAMIVAPESRTSSPIRIPRSNDTLMHEQVSGLIPCGEGAGYAGGIVSAAIDGERCADAAAGFIG